MLELFGNLLDNACKWARTRVRVMVVPGPDTARLTFSVEDDGPGVPPELLDCLGTAGLRVDESRPGHGLGLAIVGDIVAQYSGTVRFERGRVLGGLRVDVELPLRG
jgi:signal transduction histidine kinase